MELNKIFTYPYDNALILRKLKTLRRELLARENVTYLDKKIAILGGSTTAEIKNLLEVFLLQAGIRADFYESEYNKFYEDAVFGNEQLDNFQPDVIIIFTGAVNLLNKPALNDTAADVEKKLDAEFSRFEKIWQSLESKFSASIIQNNFELPYIQTLGNFDAVAICGLEHYISVLNQKFAAYANSHKNFYIHNINRLSAQTGLENWHNPAEYCAYKFAVSFDAMPAVANNLSKIIKAIFGLSKKCLVLDLDNTLWGGIIGDIGVENLQIGHETPAAEMFTEFQNYVLELKKRGVILAVCSKNDEDVAKSGFTHPDSVLKVTDFAAFRANWLPKNQNILDIAKELNIATDSLVFIDDSAFERQLVRDTMPEVSVPEVIAGDCYSYIGAIQNAGYFETVAISEDDLKRNAAYLANTQRRNLQTSFDNYDDYLKSLEMHAEISPFKEIYFDRIAQLTNKTNQFNLTTRRYTRAEIQELAADSNYITLYCRLKDKFGDNGLISVIVGEIDGAELKIILWLMSCRVLNRGVEKIMMDALIKIAAEKNLCSVTGFYFETKKNSMVKDFYKNFGFKQISQNNNDTVWNLNIAEYLPQGKFIEVNVEKSDGGGGGGTASNQHFLRI